MTTIVVGVDDSPGGDAALRWAANEARLRDARLRVVHVWQWPYAGHLGEVVDQALDSQGFEAASTKVLSTIVARVLGDEVEDIALEEHVAEGSPARVLLDEAAHADLLVVGARGRGGFRGLLLGSVSHQSAYHAACPVVIVRADTNGNDD